MRYESNLHPIYYSLADLRRNLALAIEGDAEALYQLGILSQGNHGFRSLNGNSLDFLLSAAEKGHTQAMVEAARLLLRSEDPEKIRQGKELLLKADSLDEPSCYALLGTYYSKHDSPERDDRLAEFFLKKGNRYYLLALLYGDPSSPLFEPEKAFRYLEYAGSKGTPDANPILEALGLETSLTFLKDLHLDPSLPGLSLAYDRREVSLLALAYEYGFRVEKNEEIAAKLREKAGQMGEKEKIKIVNGIPVEEEEQEALPTK